MKLAIDGDTLCYKACFATEYNVYKLEEEGYVFRYKKDCDGFIALNFDGEDFPDVIKEKVIEPISHTYHLLKIMTEGLCNELKPDSVHIFLSSNEYSNFRYMIPYPIKYKGNRPDKPIHIEEARQYLIKNYKAEVTDGYEADDALGMFLTLHNDEAVVAAVDKDLRQIPGKHYHLDTCLLTFIGEVEGLRSFYRQMLMGDRVDNIIGIDGIGIKTAEKLIDKLHMQKDMDDIVRAKYKEFFKEDWENMYKSNFDLLWVLRSEEEYQETKKYYDTRKREAEGPRTPEMDTKQIDTIGGITS
ncbi:MAG: hypothetical protein ACREAE_01895 [Nitrosopumilaceae archaeon]